MARKEATGWSRSFLEPIPVPPTGRRPIDPWSRSATIERLPKKEHEAPAWQDAMHALLLAVRGGPVMFAEIGMGARP